MYHYDFVSKTVDNKVKKWGKKEKMISAVCGEAMDS